MRKIIGTTLAVLAVLVAAPGAGAEGSRVQGPPLERLRADLERCEGMSVMLRDRVSGGVLPFGDALRPERPLVVPSEEPERYALECYDGYLVELAAPPVALGGSAAPIAAEQKAAVAAMRTVAPGLEVVRRFSTVLNVVQVRVGLAPAERLRAAGFVLEENGSVRADLAESVPLINADDVWTGQTGATGAGVKVAVVDTGVDATHPALSRCSALSAVSKMKDCKVAGGYDVVNRDNDPADDHGHGTHVASIAAGEGEHPGVAPGATVYAYKVLDATGWGTEAQVIEGIERAVDPNRDGNTSDGADVINLSLGGRGTPDEPLANAADNAALGGAIVVTAAGNATSVYHERGNITSPGVAPNVITVGASWKNDQIAFFTSRGPVEWDGRAIAKPDLVAPGVDICAARSNSGTWAGGGVCDAKGGRVVASGTSMAAAHVAGVAALLQEAGPSLSPAQVKGIMKGTATPLAIGESVLTQGAGRVDADAAIAQVDAPPVALLDPIPTDGELRSVTGRVEAPAGLLRWSLAVAAFRGPRTPESGWSTVAAGQTPPSSRELHRLVEATYADGGYVVRLSVEDARGRTAADFGHVTIDKLGFDEPLDLDVQRGGGVLPVRIRQEAALADAEYVLSVRPDESGSPWTELWRGPLPPSGWDTAGLPARQYRLRLSVKHDGITEADEIRVVLDPTLAPGFPVRVPLAGECGNLPDPCSLKRGWVDPAIVDLEDDGVSEIVVYRYGPIPEVWIFDTSGRRRSVTPVGTIELAPYYYAIDVLHPVVTADLDGDADDEVLFFNVSEGRLYVVGASGSVERSIVVPLNGGIPMFPRIVTADLDANGSMEVLLSVQVSGRDRLIVFDPMTGTKLADRWVSPSATPGQFYSPDYGYSPAVGNLDADPALEIVAVDHAGSGIHALDWDGAELPGWPRVTNPGGRPNSPPVIADLDGDGDNEVVAAVVLGTWKVELSALESDGTTMPGWPLRSNSLRLFGGPVPTDLDGGGDLELVVPFAGKTAILRHDGPEVPAWSATTTGRGDYQPLVADMDGDGRSDVLQHDASWGKGVIRAWTADGSAIPGFGMVLERSTRGALAVDPEAGVLVAASDSDTAWDAYGSPIGKGRASIHLWELEVGPAPWATFQHDPGRTGTAS